jgi:hypothetical protein
MCLCLSWRAEKPLNLVIAGTETANDAEGAVEYRPGHRRMRTRGELGARRAHHLKAGSRVHSHAASRVCVADQSVLPDHSNRETLV